ncbi:MAG: class I SAM-dependent methyltransferase [Acidobacteriota bacterium]
MLHLLRGRIGGGASDGTTSVAVFGSHIFATFLKRLRGAPRPFILDLGHLSGSNIEFFARAGCKVQVEDLLSMAESMQRPDPPRRPPPQPGPARPAAPAPAARPPGGAAAPAALGGKVGARPSRRIVLPPRSFPGHGAAPAAPGPKLRPPGPAGGRAGSRASWGTRLPTRLAFPDEAFDAVVAWDVLNYYAPDPVRMIAAEVRRVLRPGGTLLSYFDARTLEDPVSPRRYRILDEKRISCAPLPGRLMLRQVYQNRDIEKMFAGLRIVQAYFLKNSMREILMEKKVVARTVVRPRTARPAPKPRFTLE